jgi:3-oxoacyl-[acyl-carrier protein] reductase
MRDVVVVSGGATGIGRAVAEHFCREGAQVVVIGRRADRLAATAEDISRRAEGAAPVVPISGDLAAPDEVRDICAEIARRFAEVDVLVHAAGGNVVLHSAQDAYADGLDGVARRWTDNFRSNVLTAVLLTEGLRDRLRSPGGRVIFVSSIAAYRGSGNGCYGAAKAALHPYCYDVASGLGPRGITANVVAPGYIADTEFFGDRLSGERRAALVGQTMNGRAGTPADIAGTISWLASAQAAHVTGQIIQVNGGAERGR